MPLPPDVPEELVARPQGHRDRPGQADLADVEEHLADDAELVEVAAVGVLAVRERQQQAGQRDGLEGGLDLAALLGGGITTSLATERRARVTPTRGAAR